MIFFLKIDKLINVAASNISLAKNKKPKFKTIKKKCTFCLL